MALARRCREPKRSGTPHRSDVRRAQFGVTKYRVPRSPDISNSCPRPARIHGNSWIACDRTPKIDTAEQRHSISLIRGTAGRVDDERDGGPLPTRTGRWRSGKAAVERDA